MGDRNLGGGVGVGGMQSPLRRTPELPEGCGLARHEGNVTRACPASPHQNTRTFLIFPPPLLVALGFFFFSFFSTLGYE